MSDETSGLWSHPDHTRFEQQLSDLWWEEFRSDQSAFGGCILCGNSARIDTRGKVFNAKGEDVGGEAFCICPNGRAVKKAVAAASQEAGR